jgi:PKD domain
MLTLALLATCPLVLALGPSLARAVILPAVTIDGPSEDIVGFGGVAMAEDGTGGLVYLKRVGGVPHVFVSRFIDGHWLAPIRVDNEQPFAASWPRIGAAEGGQLVVVWATPYATENSRPVDELLGSTLGPGSSSFGPAILIDPDVRDGTGMTPELALSSTGRGDVVYRVVFNNLNAQQAAIPLLRPGDVIEDVRVAEFDGEAWSRLGAINRNSSVSMRPPTQDNAPRIAIGPTGNGVVVWQEPDIDGVARIWARRIFGSSLDYVLSVSVASFNGAPIGDDADAPAVAVSRLGQAEVAYRQNVSFGSPLPGPRIMLNTLPDGESADGSQFTGAAIADAAVTGGAGARVGPPSVDLDAKRNLRLLYDANGTPLVIEGSGVGLSRPLSLGPPFVGSDALSATVTNPVGGGVSAWPSADSQGAPGVAVREDFPDGAIQTGLVRGGAGGPISGLAIGRSGLGDGLVGFEQGPLGNAAIVGAIVSAPPERFILSVPKGWVRPSRALISWLPAPSANGPLSYRVVLDGRVQGGAQGGLSMRLSARGLGSGRHRVQVLATDINSQAILTPAASLRVDGQTPVVKIARAGPGASVRIRVADAGSGLAKRSVRVGFGDGHVGVGRARFSHRYSRPGVYSVVVRARDRAGNSALVRERVRA